MIAYALIISLLCIALSVVLFYSVRLNLRLRDKLDDVVDQVSESLDILDTCYRRMTSLTRTEVLSDEPIVKKCVDEIKRSRNAILVVANLMIDPVKEDDNDDKGDDNE